MVVLHERVARAAEGPRGGVVLLSENPMHDTGGGQRSAQFTLEFLARGFSVLFVSRGVVTESVDLGLKYDHPRLVEMSLDRFASPSGQEAFEAVLAQGHATIITQVAVPEWAAVLERAKRAGAATIYDCLDRWDSELGYGWYDLPTERRIANASDLLTASSPDLVHHVESLTERETHLIPNAFNNRVFRADAHWDRPDDLPASGRIVLFVGALWGRWFDWDLARDSATAWPETAFVFVGDHRKEGRRLPENCVFLGLKPQTALPAYLAHADVAFLPWHVSEMTHAMSPVTVYEHIGMGLPVVAPPIDPLGDVPGVFSAAGSARFVAALESIGRSSLDAETRAGMAAFAARNSWVHRVDDILGLVERARSRASPAGARPNAPAVKTRTMLSVVVPAYNHERFIGAAIDSVREQTLLAGELLVIDDGSSDATLDVLSAHAFAQMRWITQKNRGAHATINRAITLSEGDYIAILNSDDVFEAERLEHAWAVARATDAAMVVGSVRLIDAEGQRLSPDHDTARWYRAARDDTARAGSLRAGVRQHNIAVTTSNFFIHRELWRCLGGFRAYRYVHDYDFLLRAVALCPDRICYVDELTDVRYRVHGDNTIGEDVGRALAERAVMLRGFWAPLPRLRRAIERPRKARALRNGITSVGPIDPIVHARVATDGVPRVGIVVASLDRGGLEEIVALLARTLHGQGIGVHVLCAYGGGAVAARLRAAGVPLSVAQGREEQWRLWCERSTPDLISSHFVDLEVVEVLGEAGIPIVETVHNTYAWFSADDWSREAAKRARLAATIAVSEMVARYYERRCPGEQPSHVVPNAVDPGRAARVPRPFARRHFRLAADEPLFVHLGRVTAQKNLSGLLAAFADLVNDVPHARLILAGAPDDSDSIPRLKRAHRELFRSGSVRHFDSVPAVGTLLSAADAYVSNSLYEGWSVAASEALWAGIPVVLSDCGGARELVGQDGSRGYLIPNALGDPLTASPDLIGDPPEEEARENRRALTEALRAVVTARDEWTARGDAIRRHARTALAPARMASDYARIFREVLSR